MTSIQLENKNYVEDKEDAIEFIENHPKTFSEVCDQNPELLNDYVVNNVDQTRIEGWLYIVANPAPTEALLLATADQKKADNEVVHHTERYGSKNVVLRRGYKFKMDLTFKQRKYIPAKDKVIIEFSIGTNPTAVSGTKIRMEAGSSVEKTKWGALITASDPDKMSLEVNIPCDCIIGRYHVAVEINSDCKDGMKVERKVQPDVFIIFNPFCPDDDVYLENQALQNEYVLNDTGIIYYGTAYRQGGMKWLFGQFEEGILSIALKLLREEPQARKNYLKSLKKRSSPVHVVRILSAMVNCGDDDGVLWGNWSGDYSGGASPTSWSGSVKILKDWNENKMAPVKFGQCWVFSGVFTTVLRALGIPARSVTNFNSAHDTEFNMTIDKFINSEGDEVDIGVEDSIWNFHVWNEAWFKRKDLPKGYDGWQACDATPQEESGGVMRCGPAPLTAIKNGEIFVGQDTNFIFSEVNADRVFWRVDDNHEVTGMILRQDRHVGKAISTKAVGSDEREDITNHYKYPEGTAKEREAFERAYAHGRKADYHDKFVIEEEGAMTINIKPSSEDVRNGDNFSTNVKICNTTDQDKNVIINTVVCTLLSTDERKAILKRVKTNITIPAKSDNEQIIDLGFGEYGQRLGDCNVIRFTTTVKVVETGNLYVDRYDIGLESPNCMTVVVAETMKMYYNEIITVSITNPLQVPLTGGALTLQALGVICGDTVKINEPIPVGETVTIEIKEVLPWRKGTANIIADFDSNEISNIKYFTQTEVV